MSTSIHHDSSDHDSSDHDVQVPRACPPTLQPFVDAGVLVSADVHVATTVCRLHGEDDPRVLLAVAMAARAPRVGHVCLDVDTTVAAVVDEEAARAERQAADGTTAAVQGVPAAQLDLMASVDPVAGLPWPDPDAWLRAVDASAVTRGVDGVAPVTVEARRVYLTRYHDHERRIAAALVARARHREPVDDDHLAATLARLFPNTAADDPQRRAVATAVRRRLAVIAGGPGTGKTWTVARVLAAVAGQALLAGRPLQVALAAPTGKAAARLDEGLRDAMADMDVDDDVAAVLRDVDRGRTLHSLIGIRPGQRPWHGPDRPLPHDLVIVDEMSMSSLSMAARLLDAVRPEARVVLVGDPSQLASVEAGSVLADVVAAGDALGDSLVELSRVHRFDEASGIAALADAIRAGDGDAAIAALRNADDLTWLTDHDDVDGVRTSLADRGRAVVDAARDGDHATALQQLRELVVLCAHRRGAQGVAGWNARVDAWLGQDVDGWRPWDRWQPGRPVMATANDRHLHVFNGDIGVVVATAEGPRVAFGPQASAVPPSRLEHVDHVHAMTIHKSQGSQWRHVVAVLPDSPSRILTRELLYTAVTRAQEQVTIVGGEATIRAAIDRPIRRASGLTRRLTPAPT